MRTLIVQGATPDITCILDSASLDEVRYATTVEQAFDAVQANPRAVLAYGPGCFGAAATRQPARIYTPEPQLVLTDHDPHDVDDLPLEDPRRLTFQAATALRAHLVLDLSKESALGVLNDILGDEGVAAS